MKLLQVVLSDPSDIVMGEGGFIIVIVVIALVLLLSKK